MNMNLFLMVLIGILYTMLNAIGIEVFEDGSVRLFDLLGVCLSTFCAG